MPVVRLTLTLALALVLAVGLLSGCAPEPRPIPYGEAACAHCKMQLAQERFGAELVARTGKVYVFDAVECLAAFHLEHDDIDAHSLWVTDFADPPRLLRVDDARFLHSPTLRSPMAVNLAAFDPSTPGDSLVNAFGGDMLDWAGVLDLVRREWLSAARTPR